jgi:hypothetical protein
VSDFEYLKVKRIKVLEVIKPICDAFRISNYDYEISETGQREILRINSTQIGCSCNSTSAIVNELIGYIFITRWCRSRYLGAFSTQVKNVIKQYWVDESK